MAGLTLVPFFTRPWGRTGGHLTTAVLTTLVLAGAGAALGGVVHGAAAARGVLVGTALILVLFSVGMAVVRAVTGHSPELSLLVALLTYLLQLLLLVAALVALERSGLLVSTVDRAWTGAAVIVGAIVWSAALVRADLRRGDRYHS